MKMKKSILPLLLCMFAAFGCETVILRQDIPVTTNPMGAQIYVNGRPSGQTPTTVSLERNRNHVITLVKEDYRQEDVVIQRQYQSNRVLMKAIQSGVNAGSFFKDARMGVNSGFSSISNQEETGEAYLLVPPVVKINLTPLTPAYGSGAPSDGAAARRSNEAIKALPQDPQFTARDALQAGVVAGTAAGAANMKPMEKKWETSSSSRTYTQPDGTVVSEKSSTSVGVSVNPAGILNLIDQLTRDSGGESGQPGAGEARK